MTATAEFSYDQDVRPYASRFFDRVGSDRSLSHAAKMRVQGTLLGGMTDIEATRLKLQDERDMGRMRKLDMEKQELALEDARARRARMEAQAANISGIRTRAKEVLASGADPEAARRALTIDAIDHADDPEAQRILGLAASALPEAKKPMLTDSQLGALVLDGVPQEVVERARETGDYSEVGKIVGNLRQDQLAFAMEVEAAQGQDKRANAVRLKLAQTPLEFDKNLDDPTAPAKWLKPESTSTAMAIMETLGATPEEKAEFARLRRASSDLERARLVDQVKIRYLASIAGTGSSERSGPSGRSIVRGE